MNIFGLDFAIKIRAFRLQAKKALYSNKFLSKVPRSLIKSIFALLTYLLIELMLFDPLRHNLTKSIFMFSADPDLSLWVLYWWPFALIHHLNPFTTNYLWHPAGYNLTWVTSIPTLSLITAPITLISNPILSWNLLNLAAPVLSSFFAYFLIVYLTNNFTASVVGGYFFGFGSYELGQLLGHINLSFVGWTPPIGQ